MSGAKALCDFLASRGVDTVFLVPGAQILPLIEELAGRRDLRAICAAHELGAGFMADGWARASRRPGVVAAIGGPGAANMLAAAESAQLDDSPVLFLTGDVPRRLAGRGAFQDAGPTGTDDVAIYSRVVESSCAVGERGALAAALTAAWQTLGRGRCAHLSVAVDVMREPQAAERCPDIPVSRAPAPMKPLLAALAGASRILVLAGRRLCRPGGARSLRHFAEVHGLPVVTTLAAKGLLPEDHPLALGNCGFAGSRRANRALLEGKWDALLMIGADFTERDSLAWDDRLRHPGRVIVRVDAVPRPLRSPIAADIELIGNDPVACLDALAGLPPADLGGPREAAPTWAPEPAQEERAAEGAVTSSAGQLSGCAVVHNLRAALSDDAILVVDGGMSRVFAGQCWQARRSNGFHSATSVAPTGWGIAAGIGIQLAEPERPVVVLTGDGCALMHGVELATAARYGIPLIVVLLDNAGHGAVLRRAPGPAMEEIVRSAPVDWLAFARSLGASGVAADRHDGLITAVHGALSAPRYPGGVPSLIHVRTSPHEAYPAPESVFLSYSEYLSGTSGRER